MRNNIVLQREIEQSILNNKDIFTRRAKEILPFAVCRDRLVSKLCMLKVFTYEDLFEFVIMKSGLSSDAFPKSYSRRLKILIDYPTEKEKTAILLNHHQSFDCNHLKR